jgi:hypothetical protein
MRAVKEIWTVSASLRLFLIFAVFCLCVALAEALLSGSSSTSQAAWIKAGKFSVSLFAYSVTLAWLSAYLPGHKQLFRRVLNIVALGSALELLAVCAQACLAAAGDATTGYAATDAWLCPLARLAILPVAAAMPITYWMLWRQPNLPAVLSSAMRWGVALTIVGFIPGFLMLLPGAGHAVGCAPSTVYGTGGNASASMYGAGGSLPFLGWSTRYGDLRAAHFVGIHALQILPLTGGLVMALGTRLLPSTQKLLVACLGLSYLSTICLLTWQALRAESVVAPSTLTMEAFFASLLAGIVLTIWSGKQTSTTSTTVVQAVGAGSLLHSPPLGAPSRSGADAASSCTTQNTY